MTATHGSSTLVFDTRKLTREGGVGERQADAHAGALHEALGGVATKADIVVLRADMDALRVEVSSVVREMQALRQEMQALRQEMQALRGEMQALRGENQSLRQFVVMGVMVGFGWMTLMIGLMTVAIKFF